MRHFSTKVCEKVQQKGTTTYNEVADELVAEFTDPNNYDAEQLMSVSIAIVNYDFNQVFVIATNSVLSNKVLRAILVSLNLLQLFFSKYFS